ncbi:MAG: DUF1592 domain-containing protein [Myxococcales bacterium]|nr:DUF1592 domain-containing protein [Myxococcales bacterium]
MRHGRRGRLPPHRPRAGRGRRGAGRRRWPGAGGAPRQPADDDGGPHPARPGSGRGRHLYATHCARCHAADRTGGVGRDLTDLDDFDRDTLVRVIDATMPAGRPTACAGACAERVGDYLWALRDGAPPPDVPPPPPVEPVDCADAPAALSPRRLRLLTRREYRNTVRDLLFPEAADLVDACPPHRFALAAADAPPGTATVHVAGSFNDWAGTVAGGGWPLARTADGWALERDLPPGRHRYKFVLDEQQWIADPANPDGEDDGFGGRNSVVEVDCGAGEAPVLPADPAADVPAETRPDAFPFDDHAASGRVTVRHLEAYLDAAEVLARAALERPGFAPCPTADCAADFVRTFGRRAFRRPPSPAEVDRYAALFVDHGAEAGLTALLSAPAFLYRSELGAPDGDGVWRLTPHEAASALSYFLWASMPDDALLAAADRGPIDRAAEAARLLADDRARAVVGDFALQWLGVDALRTAHKNPDLFPDFDAALRAAMLAETADFARHVVFDGSGRFADLLTADYTVGDARLAAFYGLDRAADGTLPYADAARAGVLGHASVLATYAHSDQTSPIRRGLFVRRRLLCQELPPPPPNAGGVPEVDPDATTRERFRQHTDDDFCRGCHQYIDGVGFGFERFDALGRWRDTEAGQPVDARGELNDLEGFGAGTQATYEGVHELAALLADSDAARDCFVRQTFRFAQGREDAADDACAVRDLRADFDAAGGDVRALLTAVAAHPSFVLRREAP